MGLMHFPAFHQPEQTWGTKRGWWNKVLQGTLATGTSLSFQTWSSRGCPWCLWLPDVCDLCLLWSHLLLSVLSREEQQQELGTEMSGTPSHWAPLQEQRWWSLSDGGPRRPPNTSTSTFWSVFQPEDGLKPLSGTPAIPENICIYPSFGN